MSQNRNHKWEPRWDDESDSCIEFCRICHTKRRNKVLYFKGAMKRSGTITEYFVDNQWSALKHPPCNQIKK